MTHPISLEEILARVDNLPTLSQVALRVGEMVNDPRVGPKEIAETMRHDPSLSAKVLRLVNSAYYAIPGGVSDVVRAISFVGFNTLHQLVLSASVLRNLRTPAGSTFDARGLWLHALAVGTCAEVLARRIGHRDPGGCFTAGLLHDIGKVGLAITEPARYGAALDSARRLGIPMADAERAAGLPSHDVVGSRLARRWRFPAQLLVPIAYHHQAASEQVRHEIPPALLPVVDVVALADHLVRSFRIGDGGSPSPERGDAALERIGLTRQQAGEVHADLMRRLETSKIFLELIEAQA